MDHSTTSFWTGRRVLVTGATGFLGSWLVDDVVARGAAVVILLRDWVPSSMLVEGGAIARTTVVRGDLDDYDVLVRTLNEHAIDTVFHLGAQSIVGTAARSPRSTFEANVQGTWNLLEACRTCPKLVERVVVASSDKAYGVHDVLPYTEDMPLQGRAPYDVSKSCADLIALSYAQSFGTPVAITRCGNVFGGGDQNYSRLIPGTIRSALRDEPPVIRSDGSFGRDYFYVRDAVSAYVTLAEQMVDGRLAGEAFNFGNERTLAAAEVVHAILRIMGKTSLVPTILSQADGEIPNQYLDCSKARRMLGWSPRFGFDGALEETIEWYRARLGPRNQVV
jgi:CDP-glucose 4,6-dehydratase